MPGVLVHSWLQGLYSSEHSSTSARIGEVSSLPQSCPRAHCHCCPGTTGKLSRYQNMGLNTKMHPAVAGTLSRHNLYGTR